MYLLILLKKKIHHNIRTNPIFFIMENLSNMSDISLTYLPLIFNRFVQF